VREIIKKLFRKIKGEANNGKNLLIFHFWHLQNMGLLNFFFQNLKLELKSNQSTFEQWKLGVGLSVGGLTMKLGVVGRTFINIVEDSRRSK
jgi:hypothetical protein